MSALQNVILMLTVQAFLGCVHGRVVFNSIRVDSSYHEVVVRLACSTEGSDANAAFYSEGNGTIKNLTLADGTPLRRELTLTITPDLEGEFYCEIGGVRSINSVTLVAYPNSDPTITRSYMTRPGRTVKMECTISIGVLNERYFVEWFKGLVKINTSSEEFSHIHIDPISKALVFAGAKISDSSRGYFCNVSVDLNNRTVFRQGSTVALNVITDLRMEENATTAPVGEGVRFTCRASGVPAPQFRWLLNGAQFSTGITTTSRVQESTVHVTSKLQLSAKMKGTANTVTCMAFHEGANGLDVVTSSIDLTALSRVNEENVGKQDAGGSGGASATVPVVAVLIVLIIVGIIVVLIVGTLIYRRKWTFEKDSSSFDGSIQRSVSRSSCSSRGSRHSSRSGSSRASSRSSRSRTYGSESGASQDSKERAVVANDFVMQDVRDYETMDHKMLKQWKEKKTYRHQLGGSYGDIIENTGREQGVKNGGQMQVDGGHPVRSGHEPIIEPIERVHHPAKNEAGLMPVFPHTHIGIPNPLSPQRPAFKESDSSFEDLEVECLQLSTEIPRSC